MVTQNLEFEIRNDSENGEFCLAVNDNEGEVVEYGSASVVILPTGELFVGYMADADAVPIVCPLTVQVQDVDVVECDFGPPEEDGEEDGEDGEDGEEDGEEEED